ncbi:MAG: ERCC4 domain-containing protein [Clostridia bacterium]|nr:ERCC4 domain-containing protein [Clostridia bacterium]
MYNPAQIEKMLESMVVLYDTREQDTEALRRRLSFLGFPSERFKLDYGDYSLKYTDISGDEIYLTNICIERKMNLDELALCFGKERKRFKREFDRAKENNAKIHLIIENAAYEKIYSGKYRSQLKPQSMIASLLSWSARYNMRFHFCKAELTGWLIGQILQYELRNYLLLKGADNE